MPASGQAWPHAPQLSGSVARSRQVLPQGENGLWHAKLQLPVKQMPLPFAGALHVAPQPPQFFAFELVSTQPSAQAVSALAQWPVPIGVLAWPARTHSCVAVSQT